MYSISSLRLSLPSVSRFEPCISVPCFIAGTCTPCECSVLSYVSEVVLGLFSCSLFRQITVSDNMSSSDIFNLTASYLQLNASFTAFSIFLISINPYIGFKLAPLFSCLTGFVGGFMIPGPQMASW